MSESLPRRVFPAIVVALAIIVVALAIIVLTLTPLLAGAGLPVAFGTGAAMVLGLIPVIVIETLVLRRGLRLEWPRVLIVATVTNIVSTMLGLLALVPFSGHVSHDVLNPISSLIMFVPLFFVSWWVEYWVGGWMLRHKRPGSVALSPKPATALRPTASLLRSEFNANVASYLFLAMSVVTLWASGILRPAPLPYQAIAVASLRTLNTAEITYSPTYNRGFSPSLAALAPAANGGANPTAEAAGLIDSVLASGEKGGYRFVYSPGPRNEKGEITTYAITASPINSETGSNYYYTDQSGVIRENGPSTPASAADSPIAGSVLAPAIDSLRTLNRVEITYNATYHDGYSPTLSSLAPPPEGTKVSANAAGLIDSILATGQKGGYRFDYSPGSPDKNGRITSYRITASPIGSETGNYYYTDQTGVIRVKNPTRPATKEDWPVAG